MALTIRAVGHRCQVVVEVLDLGWFLELCSVWSRPSFHVENQSAGVKSAAARVVVAFQEGCRCFFMLLQSLWRRYMHAYLLAELNSLLKPRAVAQDTRCLPPYLHSCIDQSLGMTDAGFPSSLRSTTSLGASLSPKLIVKTSCGFLI
jgi:hypothetical protein